MSPKKILSGLVATIAILLASCTLQQAKDARDAALTAEQLACIMNSALLNDAALAKACDIADKLLPVIHDLVGVREGAKKSGVAWHVTTTVTDGGAK